jgi:hypothetical protein
MNKLRKTGGPLRSTAAAVGMLCGLAAGPGEAIAATAQPPECCPVVELRQYIVYPGMRDDFISLFEKEFIESQESVGITLVGQFRDVNDPHRFTWLRGFAGMDARKKALGDFYSGPLWGAHRNRANAALYDNDDVLLLRPASPGSGFMPDPRQRPPAGADLARGGFVVATLYYIAGEVTAEFVAHFNGKLMPLFEQSGARVLGRFVTEKSRNTFERLPVRENVNVFAWFASFADRQAYDRFQAQLANDGQWRGQLFGTLYKSLLRPPEVLMLAPTARSLAR